MRLLALGLLTALSLTWFLQSDEAFARFAGVGARGAGASSWGPARSSKSAAFHRIGRSTGHRVEHVFRFDPLLHRHRPFRLTKVRDGMWLWPFSFGLDALPAPSSEGSDNLSAGGAIESLHYEQPSCRLQRESQLVPSENGGETKIGITRCVIPYRALLATRQLTDRSTDGEGDDVSSSIGRTAGEADPRVPGCRIESRVVPAEGGGERTVTIRRC